MVINKRNLLPFFTTIVIEVFCLFECLLLHVISLLVSFIRLVYFKTLITQQKFTLLFLSNCNFISCIIVSHNVLVIDNHRARQWCLKNNRKLINQIRISVKCPWCFWDCFHSIFCRHKSIFFLSYYFALTTFTTFSFFLYLDNDCFFFFLLAFQILFSFSLYLLYNYKFSSFLYSAFFRSFFTYTTFTTTALE